MKIKVKMENGDRSGKGMVYRFLFSINKVWQNEYKWEIMEVAESCLIVELIYQQEHVMPQGETVLISLADHTLVPSAWETWLCGGCLLTGSHLSQT